jgi:hypothetical protein
MLGIDRDLGLAAAVGALSAGAEESATVATPEERIPRLDTSSACPFSIDTVLVDLP